MTPCPKECFMGKPNEITKIKSHKYFKSKCPTLSHFPCHVITLASCLPPPFNFPHYPHFLLLVPHISTSGLFLWSHICFGEESLTCGPHLWNLFCSLGKNSGKRRYEGMSTTTKSCTACRC